ncbi:MAG: helix-turn-helix transcriptional regulator [Bacteroidota bacterium]
MKEISEEHQKRRTNLTIADLRWLEKVEEKILAQISNGQFKLRDLAQDLYLSTRRLQQKIKQLTGQTPKAYQRQIKLQAAKKILESGQVQTVSELSYQLGYEDQHYFSCLYKKQFGITPKEELSQ